MEPNQDGFLPTEDPILRHYGAPGFLFGAWVSYPRTNKVVRSETVRPPNRDGFCLTPGDTSRSLSPFQNPIFGITVLEKVSTEPATPQATLPSRAELEQDFGEDYLSIQSLFQFCFVPGGRLSLLKELAPEEEWGQNNFVLLKYLAVHIRVGIEQGRYVWNGDQIVMTAGHLTTAKGLPLYLGLVKNSTPNENPWVMNWVGERPSCAELPEPPDLGDWPKADPSYEIVVACDLASEERRFNLPGLDGDSAIAQSSAVTGAIHWAMHRKLAVPQIHGGGRGYFVPIFLSNRDDLTAAPDLVAPLMVQQNRIVVRTLLDPHVAYSPARAVVERWEQLPAWLLDAWDAATENMASQSAAEADEEDDQE